MLVKGSHVSDFGSYGCLSVHTSAHESCGGKLTRILKLIFRTDISSTPRDIGRAPQNPIYTKSANGLLSDVIKPMLTEICVAIWCH